MSETISKKKIIVSSDEDSEDESGSFLEESPCGRWVKRKEIVDQRNIPGIDSAHLAMDTEEGVEVVWNEVHFSERQNFKTQQERMQIVFEHIIHLDHPNIVKFHHYWTDTHSEIPRLIFITEYMSLGSLKMFLKRAKLSVKRLSLQAWKRWCTQILSALSYLHSSSPPIIHGNLTCDTIFIQHNGLVKIGSVAPDSIHKQFKRCWLKNMHFIAPEFGTAFSPAVDIYSFGMCALEMVALDIQGNGDFGNIVTNEIITRTINSLEDSQQKDFIMRCVDKQHTNRPSARELLFHPLLFEVHSLKLLAAHCLVKSSSNISETITDDLIVKLCMPDDIIAEIIHKNGHGRQIRLMDIPIAEKLEKYVEDVKNGIYPLIAFGEKLPPSRSMVLETPVTVVPEPEPQPAVPVELLFEVPEPQPEEPVELLFEVPEPQPKEPVELLFEVPEPEVTSYAAETRRIRTMECTIQQDEHELEMKLLLLMDDNVNRQVSCKVIQGDSAVQFAEELEQYGFINKLDCDNVTMLIESAFRKMAQQSNIEEAMQNLSMENSPHPVQESQSTTRNEDDLPQSPETAAENELLLQPSTSATKQLMKLLPSKEKDLDKLSWKTLITIANGLFNPHKRKRLLHAITNIMENDMEHDSE